MTFKILIAFYDDRNSVKLINECFFIKVNVLPVWLENCTEFIKSTSKPKSCNIKKTKDDIYIWNYLKVVLVMERQQLDCLRIHEQHDFESIKPFQAA